MNIKMHEIPVREVSDGYVDSAEMGVKGYGGRLNIRPAYQREFVYNPQQRDAVIRTVRHDFPLNVMYWVRNDEGGYEMLDGQQRTISTCRYVKGKFSIDHRTFENLTKEEKEQILDYKLMVYVCEGTDREKLDWFDVVEWVGATFTNTRVKLMKGLPWGIYFNKYGNEKRDPDALEARIAAMLRDDEDVGDITNQRGIYEYLLDGDERHLSIRQFSDKMARTAYERQGGVCPKCGRKFAIEEMQADHITPWSKGGRTTAENCQMLCADCNRRKSDV